MKDGQAFKKGSPWKWDAALGLFRAGNLVASRETLNSKVRIRCDRKKPTLRDRPCRICARPVNHEGTRELCDACYL